MKIGLFICGCGRNISGTIDINKVLDHFLGLSDVFVFEDQYLCSETGLNKIIKEIKKKKNNSMLHFEVLKSIENDPSNYKGGNWFSCKKPDNFSNPSQYL